MSEYVVDRYGTKRWYKNGDLHREDGPAEVWPDGSKWWYQNGVLHREDGPAIEESDGSNYWFKNGQRHRDGGPSCTRSDGTVEYWLDDVQIPGIEWFIKFGGINE